MFSEEIGLAIERPPKGLTLEQLWKIF